ncbi:acid-sensing ion channel 1A-like isoform X2 [Oculina patagonica]
MNTQVEPMRVFSTDFWKEKVELGQTTQSYSRWEAYAHSTTLHGLRHVFERGYSFAKRLIWLILLCSATAVCLYLNSKSTAKFFSKPIKTIISQETPIKGLKFPAVTICNLNKFMKSKIDVADEDENFEKMGLNISGCSKIRTVRGNLTCGQALLCAHVWYGTVLVNGCNETKRQNIVDVLNRSSERLFNEEEFLTKYGHDMASMFVVYCRFMRNTKCSDKDFVPTVTQNGLCFTFNSGHNDTVLYSLFEGPDLGLNIILNVQTNESTLSEFSNGLKVIVHDQKTFVNRHNGFNILPGTHASVAVKLRKHIRLPAPFRTNCQQTKLPGIGSYTKDGCLYQCIVNTTITQCGCRRLGLPEPKEAPLCSMQDSSCVFNSRSKNMHLSKKVFHLKPAKQTIRPWVSFFFNLSYSRMKFRIYHSVLVNSFLGAGLAM